MSEQQMLDGQAIEHHMMDAIIMSASAIILMAKVRHDCWRGTHLTKEDWRHDARKEDSQALRRTCELLNEAMQFIGDVNNGTDAVDEYKMTDAAFAAMRRALSKPNIERSTP